MKTKMTILALAIFATVNVNATSPASWSVVANGSASEKGEVAWGDFNNDGYLDLFQLSDNVYKLYMNNGNETFSDVSGSKLPGTLPGGLNESSVIFLDYNNDNNLDILLVGWPLTNATLYKNSGAPDYTYTIDSENSLLSVRTGNGGNAHAILSAADYNNDGWVDLFLEGWCDVLNNRIVTLYKNTNGVFTRQTTPVEGNADFEGMNGGSLHTGDVNNDGYVDLITSGYSVVGSYKTYLYMNQGNGTFIKSGATFIGIEQGESVLFDSNDDGWLDVFIAGVGYEGGWAWPGNLYQNNQDGTFTLLTNVTNLPSGKQGYTSFASGDTNNDGKTDLMVMLPDGENTAMYYNNGDNSFLKEILPTETRARAGSMDLADFNNDNKLDYFLFGYNDNLSWLGVFVKNTIATTNLAPAIPTNIVATRVNGKYLITWDKSTDDITPQNAIRYNFYIQDEIGKQYAYSPADILSGRLKTGSANLLNNNEVTLDLAVGEYTIGIQAVDQANVASAFVSASLSTITGMKNALTSTVEVKSTKGLIEIQNNGAKEVDFVVLTLNGQLLQKGVCSANSAIKLPVNNQGIYMVKVSQDKISRVVKVSIL